MTDTFFTYDFLYGENTTHCWFSVVDYFSIGITAYKQVSNRFNFDVED